MDFEKYLLKQIQMHPSMQPQDLVKLCYQAAFGAEHLLGDLEKAKAYLQAEYNGVTQENLPLCEPISEEICRVNLSAWKFHGLDVDWLFPMLAQSPFYKEERESMFLSYLQAAERILAKGVVEFSAESWQVYLAAYQKAGLSPVHHSPQYWEKEKPAYRIINRKFVRLFPVLQKVAEVLSRKERCIIAIDGRAASGKTTMAKQLQSVLEADVIQMDDFFLPLELRTPERFALPGGNVHQERFCEEVLPYISSAEPFSYRIFDCSRMAYHGRREIGRGKIRIVEGSYSCHPLFGAYADITVFSDVESEEQMRRILERNGVQMVEMFRDRWIPFEEDYFRQYGIAEKADIKLGIR